MVRHACVPPDSFASPPVATRRRSRPPNSEGDRIGEVGAMNRTIVFTTLGVGLIALLAPAVALADHKAAPGAPFGHFDGLASGGNGAVGTVGLTGWALAQDGVFAVDIVVDGGIVGRATYARQRPRVAVLYPGFPDSAAAGFGYQLDTTHFLNGLHAVSARVQSR